MPFQFDELLSESEICNLKREREEIQRLILEGQKIVVYAPRNFGKTSLIKNVVIPWFKKKNPRSFVFFVDLMDVSDTTLLTQRVYSAFSQAVATSFPGQHLIETAKTFLSSLRPQVELDPLSGSPILSFGINTQDLNKNWTTPFKIIREKIAPKFPTLLVLDEFQDLSFVKGALAEIRNEFQSYKKVPIITMGSKHHILHKVVGEPNAPLAQFGQDVTFNYISYSEYHDYISTRFLLKKIKITQEVSQFLQDILNRVPESINIVCAQILESYSNKLIKNEDVITAISKVMEKRQSRMETYLGFLSPKEQEVIIAVAKANTVLEPNGKDFLRRVQSTPRTVLLNIKKLEDRGLIEKNSAGAYRVTDPILSFYLRRFR